MGLRARGLNAFWDHVDTEHLSRSVAGADGFSALQINAFGV